jgi:hypothetical protein
MEFLTDAAPDDAKLSLDCEEPKRCNLPRKRSIVLFGRKRAVQPGFTYER